MTYFQDERLHHLTYHPTFLVPVERQKILLHSPSPRATVSPRMGENSGIEWTDHTFNPWIGCTRVSPACDHCYAEAWAKRYGTAEWGTGKPRKLTSESNWKQPLKWNHEAMTSGIRRRVFCASLADVFDNEVDPAWRNRLWNLIGSTRHLDWLLLSKRIGNVPKMLPQDWGQGWNNVWLGISVVNQNEADRDIPKLIATPAQIRFLSMEPLLGPVTLWQWDDWNQRYEGPAMVQEYFRQSSTPDSPAETIGLSDPGIDWVIVGGESGKDARAMQLEWAKSLRDQCSTLGVPFFFKQWGEWGPITSTGNHESLPYRDGMVRFGKKKAGRLLDNREWNELPIAV